MCNSKEENSYFEAKSGFKFVSPSRLAVITKHFPLLKKWVVRYKEKLGRNRSELGYVLKEENVLIVFDSIHLEEEARRTRSAGNCSPFITITMSPTLIEIDH